MLNYNIQTIITMFTEFKVTEIYYIIDGFCKVFALQKEKTGLRTRNTSTAISPIIISDVIKKLLVLVQASAFSTPFNYVFAAI